MEDVYRTSTGIPGIAVKSMPIPRIYLGGHTDFTEYECQVPVLNKKTNLPSVGYRYLESTEVTELLGTGISRPRAEKIPVPPVLWSRIYRTAVPAGDILVGVPKCDPGVQGVDTEKCRTYIHTRYQSVRYRY